MHDVAPDLLVDAGGHGAQHDGYQLEAVLQILQQRQLHLDGVLVLLGLGVVGKVARVLEELLGNLRVDRHVAERSLVGPLRHDADGRAHARMVGPQDDDRVREPDLREGGPRHPSRVDVARMRHDHPPGVHRGHLTLHQPRNHLLELVGRGRVKGAGGGRLPEHGFPHHIRLLTGSKVEVRAADLAARAGEGQHLHAVASAAHHQAVTVIADGVLAVSPRHVAQVDEL